MSSPNIESEQELTSYDIYSLDDTLEVEILQVDSPSSFWITPIEVKSKQYELTMSMIKHYIDDNKGRRIEENNLTFGKACAVRDSLSVRRARIVSVDEANYAEVWLIDLGIAIYCYTSSIYHLDDKFKTLPAAVIQCGLANVQPKDRFWHNSMWVLLSIQGKDLGDDLIREGDARPRRPY